MKKMFEWIKKKFGKYLSPTFFLLLLLSLVMWYMIKLGHTYTAYVMVPVNIEGIKIKVKCEAEGTGYRLFAHRFLRRSDLGVSFAALDVTPSLTNRDMYVINPTSLQKAISSKIKDLEINAVSEIPEIPARDI